MNKKIQDKGDGEKDSDASEISTNGSSTPSTNSRAASKSATPSNGSPRQINRWTNILQDRQINRQADLFMALTNYKSTSYKSVKPSNGSPRQINKWIDIPLEGQIDLKPELKMDYFRQINIWMNIYRQ